MNQQLTTIASGLADRPSNIAKALGNVGDKMFPPVAPRSQPPDFNVPLRQLDRSLYPGIRHWTQERYLAMRKRGKFKDEDEGFTDIDGAVPGAPSASSKSEGSTLSCYMEDENGAPIPNTQRDAARTRARMFWRGLFNQGLAPPKSGEADATITDEHVAFMEDGFPWLRYCGNHWKSLQIWRNHYSSWCKDRTKEAAKVKVAAEGNIIDVDDG